MKREMEWEKREIVRKKGKSEKERKEFSQRERKDIMRGRYRVKKRI